MHPGLFLWSMIIHIMASKYRVNVIVLARRVTVPGQAWRESVDGVDACNIMCTCAIMNTIQHSIWRSLSVWMQVTCHL